MITPSIIWLKDSRVLKQVNSTIQVLNSLETKIYTLECNQRSGELYLEEYADKFHFDFKVYGMESNLISHIMKTFKNTSGNLGILFNGIKGTGKTITAKIIANEMNLPVVLINSPYPGLADFISKINCPCIFFFDEFEKNFNSDEGHDLELLSIMDGVFNSENRKIFMLTTNKLHINENFIGRPSRIRYKKYFGNLSPEVVKEYLDDCLVYKEREKEILEFIDSLAISTIDVLKCVVEEVNIHNCPVSEFRHFINVELAKHSYLAKVIYYYPNEEHSMEIFKETLAKVGTKETNSKGEEYTLDEDDLEIRTRMVNSTSSIQFLQAGDVLNGFGTIIEPLNMDGILVTEDETCKTYIKILNLDNRPSLYRGNLVY